MGKLAYEKHHQCKLQVMTTTIVNYALVDDKKKHHQRKLQRVKTILGTSRSRMQEPNAGSTRASSG